MSTGHSREVGKEMRWKWEGTIGPTVNPPLKGYWTGSYQYIDLEPFTCKITMSSGLSKFLDFREFRLVVEKIATKADCKLTSAHLGENDTWVFEIKPNRRLLEFLEQLEWFLPREKIKDPVRLRIELEKRKPE